jgi:hypothetical protein
METSAMKVSSTGAFDRLQQALTAELVRAIKAELEKVETPVDLIEQLTGSIAFSVTCVIDDVAGFDAEGETVSPFLTFDLGNGSLESCGDSSYLHEYVYKVLPGMFSSGSNKH